MKLHKFDVYMIMLNKMIDVKLEACNDHRINKWYTHRQHKDGSASHASQPQERKTWTWPRYATVKLQRKRTADNEAPHPRR